MTNNKRAINIGIVLAVVVLVLGLWFFKTNKASNQDTTIYVSDVNMEDLKSQGKPILLDFTATWCVPCKTFNPTLERVKKELGDKVIIKIVDVDKGQSTASLYPLQVIPSQVLITADGKPFKQSTELDIFGFRSFEKDGSGSQDLVIHEGAMSDAQLKRLFKEMGMK
jgi:thioredoxin 1